MVLLSGSGLLPKAALKEGTREERRHQRERLYKRQAPAAGARCRAAIAHSAWALVPAASPARSGPYAHISLATTKNHRLEKEKSATHVYLSHKVAEPLTSLPLAFPRALFSPLPTSSVVSSSCLPSMTITVAKESRDQSGISFYRRSNKGTWSGK